MTYKVFVDDSGQKDYGYPYSKDTLNSPPDWEQYPEYWRSNYFVLAGVRVAQTSIGEINLKVNQLKKQYFGTHKIEVKSSNLRHPDRRKHFYLEPYSLKQETLNEFGQKYVDLISEHSEQMKIFSTVFDKRYFGSKARAETRGNPLLKSTQVLFERIQYAGGKNVVVFDQMESSLRKVHGSHKHMIKVLHNEEAIGEIYVKEYSNIKDVLFAKSSTENFLQIADVCAYNVFRQFCMFGREWDGSKNGELSVYDYFSRIANNFHCNSRSKQVRGYGLVCIPDIKKINWKIISD